MSSFPVDLHIAMTLPFAHGIAFAKLLASNGLALAEAHAALGRLVQDHAVTVTIDRDAVDALVNAVERMGLSVSVLRTVRASRVP